MAKPISQVEEFDPFRVRPLPNQPRKRFRGIADLAASIREVGQATPGIVTRVTDDPEFDAQLVDGERRLRACRNLGVKFRAEVRTAAGDVDTFVASFAANFGKQDHDCIEIAEGLRRLRDAGKTTEQLARIAGKSGCWVSQHLSLLKLHADVQAMLIPPADGEDEKPPLALSIALLLVPLPAARQLSLARKIAKQGVSLVAARRMVIRERMEAGETAQEIAGGHGKRRLGLATLSRALENVSERVGVFLDMPGDQFAAMVTAEEIAGRREALKAIEDVTDDLLKIADTIEKHLPKMRKVS